ncbi:MAG: nitrous oxide reductase family maturation protein NosD [Thermotogae bacterium]|nr:nitrous oxide reductase family maturation protein NosD [Thermotogota bacterium]
MFALASFLFATSVSVCDGECDFSSIKTALRHVQEGDTILVKGGVYREGRIIIRTSKISLIGIDKPVIDGQYKHQMIHVLKADSILIKGFVFKNSGWSMTEDIAAVKITECDGCKLEDNEFWDNFWAIYYEKSKRGVIRNNTVVGFAKVETTTGNALHMWNCDSMLVENNHLQGHRDGIYLEFVTNSVFRYNYSTHNVRYGIHFMFSHDDLYEYNTFVANGVGIAVMYSKRVLVRYNRFEHHWGGATFGFLLKEIYDSELYANYLYRNTYGFYLEGSVRNRIYDNILVENGIAIRLWANSTDNVITHNNIVGNTFDLITNNFKSFNTIEENYWSNYRGYDVDHDGFGDVPYRPIKLFSVLSSRSPALMVLLRSPLVQLMDLSERMLPSVIPEALQDKKPYMRPLPLKPPMKIEPKVNVERYAKMQSGNPKIRGEFGRQR